MQDTRASPLQTKKGGRRHATLPAKTAYRVAIAEPCKALASEGKGRATTFPGIKKKVEKGLKQFQKQLDDPFAGRGRRLDDTAPEPPKTKGVKQSRAFQKKKSVSLVPV